MAVTTSSLTVTDGAGVSRGLATLTDPATLQHPINSLDEAGMAVYRFSSSFTPLVTAALTLVRIAGSATKTVRIRRITVSGHSTANAQETLVLQRVSTLGTGGTAVTPTAAKNDSGTVAAATAVVTHYTTAAQSVGTAAGGALTTMDVYTGVVTTPTVALPAVVLFPELGSPAGQALVLRGTADAIEIQNANAGNLSAGTVLQYTVEFVEDAS